ncbi:MAG TPA: hypothetical protein VND93_24585 [Myxococcales bacterium]|nr:hypothetical protein [Myxococcales bacterium]
MNRIFLLSPASSGGLRAKMLLHQRASFDLARRVQTSGAPLAEVFTFLSSLYFRGKVAYVRRFAAPPAGLDPALIITTTLGLVSMDHVVDAGALRAFEGVDIHHREPRYARPLQRTAAVLAQGLSAGDQVVLLGSVASGKYVEVLLPIFGDRLVFPECFVGRGDMSRGGVMLRAAESGKELSYIPVSSAVRRGSRPPKLTATAFR